MGGGSLLREQEVQASADRGRGDTPHPPAVFACGHWDFIGGVFCARHVCRADPCDTRVPVWMLRARTCVSEGSHECCVCAHTALCTTRGPAGSGLAVPSCAALCEAGSVRSCHTQQLSVQPERGSGIANRPAAASPRAPWDGAAERAGPCPPGCSGLGDALPLPRTPDGVSLHCVCNPRPWGITKQARESLSNCKHPTPQFCSPLLAFPSFSLSQLPLH